VERRQVISDWRVRDVAAVAVVRRRREVESWYIVVNSIKMCCVVSLGCGKMMWNEFEK
jgi:hypothetical protein